MIGNDANADVLQLATRVTGSTEVAIILATHPHWDKTPQRLQYPSVDRDGKLIALSDMSDHVSPATRIGCVNVQSSSPLATWKGGRKRICKR
jgi:hypothetical protein